MRKQGINIGDVFGGQLFLDFQAEQGIGTDAPPLQEIILLEHVANRAADVNAPFGRGKLPCSMERIVDLPQPEGPTMDINSPAWTERLR